MSEERKLIPVADSRPPAPPKEIPADELEKPAENFALLPCPFCGYVNTFIQSEATYAINCRRCSASGPCVGYLDAVKNKALKASLWNARCTDAQAHPRLSREDLGLNKSITALQTLIPQLMEQLTYAMNRIEELEAQNKNPTLETVNPEQTDIKLAKGKRTKAE